MHSELLDFEESHEDLFRVESLSTTWIGITTGTYIAVNKDNKLKLVCFIPTLPLRLLLDSALRLCHYYQPCYRNCILVLVHLGMTGGRTESQCPRLLVGPALMRPDPTSLLHMPMLEPLISSQGS